MKTFKIEYITTLFFLTLLIALAWYYLFLMAANPMDTMMQNKNPMTMSMETASENEMSMNSMSDTEMTMDSMNMNEKNSSILSLIHI